MDLVENRSFLGPGGPGVFLYRPKRWGAPTGLLWMVLKNPGVAQTTKTTNFQPNPKMPSAKPPLSTGKRPVIQVITAKRALYLKPVESGRMNLPTDSFQGVVVAWSRFGGSLREALLWVISANVWDWTSPMYRRRARRR